MQYELATDADFSALPLEPRDRFLALEAICRRNLNQLINQDSTLESDRLIRLQYMRMVASAAEELKVEGVRFPVEADPASKFDDFLINIAGITTKLRLSGTRIGDPNSVAIRFEVVGLVKEQIRVLKHTIMSSDLPENLKKQLLIKLNDLAEEIVKPRARMAHIMHILAIVAAGVGGTTGFLATAPDAIVTITALIGEEKSREDEEVKRLGLDKPKQLPAPIPETGHEESDDDLPF
ncbi:hypothetical protein LZG00_05660 [Rhodobacteraceae bacterium LMO-12]|nr:hypothetical protein [Rhodobacteraceae bacterium LMO-JJ12]